jgi:hypothetical protein
LGNDISKEGIMKLLIVTLVTWFGLLSCLTMATAAADEQGAGE